MHINPKKNSGLQRDSNPWPLRQRCSALPIELWRPIHWEQANLFNENIEWIWYELRKYKFKWGYGRRSGKYIIIIILCVEGHKGQVLYIVYVGSWNCVYALMKLSANVYFWHSSTALTNTNTMFYSHFQTLQANLYFDTEFSNKLDNQAGKVWVSMYKLERNAQVQYLK